jgi:magnesium transporter
MTDEQYTPLPEIVLSAAETRLSDDHIAQIREALEEDNAPEALRLLEDFHASDTATLFGLIESDERLQLVQVLFADFDAEILTYLDDEIRSEIIGYLGKDKTAEALGELETDDAVQIIEDLAEDEKQELLEAVSEETRAEIEEGLAYPEDSAGRLMNTRFAAVPEFWTVGDVIDYLRDYENREELPDDFYAIMVVDPRYHPVGAVMTSRVMQYQREAPIRNLMREELHAIPAAMDREEAANLFRRYGLVETPVVNAEGRMVGVLTLDDIIHVIAEEEEEDYLRAGGVFDRDLHAGLFATVRRRLPWLIMNLMTANFAAFVISQFEGVIEKWVTLVVLMPMIASMAGNAGTQSVTVAVRAIATRELQSQNAWPVIRKEMLTNLCNGIVLSALMATVIMVIYKDWHLASIFATATIAVLTVAGLSGSLIPLMLHRYKIDPAIASGVFLTMLTDVLSFFCFLGLAAWVVL